MKVCQECESPVKKSGKIYCSSSCAATSNNRKRSSESRTKQSLSLRKFYGEINPIIKVNDCQYCGLSITSISRKYCSIKCGTESRKKTIEEKRATNSARQSKYRQKQYRKLAPDADLAAIRKIYSECPEGHEVDHIIPLSKGGLHHQDNLQYLPRKINRSKGSRLDWCAGSDSN